MADGTISQLNFEVILDDKNFTKAIEADKKAAKELNTTLSSVLNLKKQVGKASTEQAISAQKVREAEAKAEAAAAKAALAQQKVATETERTRIAAEKHASAVKSVNTGLTSTSNIMRTIAQLTGVTFGVIGMRRFLSSLIDITGQFEVQRMALRNMLQDVEGADKIFKDLYDFSSQSTYRFSELAKYSKQLAAFNIGKDSLLETTKMLGDVASGVGVSMDRLILAYGHVKSSGFLRGIQLRSFSQNGVPILEELSKMFTEIEGKAVSLGDVFDKMTKREIPFEMVEEAFKRMTSEGGKFYQMQEVLAKTLAGQINILKGKWENMMYAIGQSEEGSLKNAVQMLTWIVEHMDTIANVLKPVIVGLGAYAAALMTAAAAQGIMNLAKVATQFITLAKNCGLAAAAVLSFGSAAKAAAVGLGIVVTVIAGIAMAAKSIGGELEDFRKKLDEVHDEARNGNAYDREISNLERLQGILNNTNLGYSTRKEALDRIKQIVPGYLADLTEEGKLINNNAEALNQYVAALNKKAMMRGAEDELVELYNMRRAAVRELDAAKGAKAAADAATGFVGGTSITGVSYNYIGDTAAKAASDVATSEAKIAEVDTRIARVMKEINEVTTSGAESTNEMVYNVSSIVEGIEKIDSELSKLRAKAKKGGITVEEKETLDKLKSDREEQTKLYKELMGVDYDKDKKAGENATAKALKGKISELKAEAQVLEKYQSAYEKLEPIFGEDTQAQMEKIFGSGEDYTTLTEQIDGVTTALRSLGKEGEEAAEVIETRLGIDAVSKIIKAQKEIESQRKKQDKWQKTLRTWEKDWGGDYSGFEDDLDKVVRDYNDERKKIDNEYADALKELRDAHEGNAEAIWEEKQSLDALYEARKKAALNDARNDIVDQAKKYVKERTADMDLTQWGDKSIGQVYRLWKDVSKMAGETPEIDQDLKDRLYKAGLTLGEFRKNVKEGFSNLALDIQEEFFKKVAKLLNEFGDIVADVAGRVAELAAMTGKDTLAHLARDLAEVAELAGAVGNKLAQGDYIGAAVSYITKVADAFLDAATASAELRKSIAETAEEARRQSFADNLNKGVSSIFGADDLAKVTNAVTNIQKLQKLLALDKSNLQGQVQTKDGARWYDWLIAPFKPGGVVNQLLNIFKGSREFESVSSMAAKLGMDLYDEYGNLNATTLRAIVDTYTDLRKEDKAWIESAINNSEAYAEAMEQVDEIMESLFGEIASSVTDTIVDGWINARSAALDYADVVSDVAKAYSKMMVKSMILDEVLNEDAVKAVKDAFVRGDYGEAMALVEQSLQRIADMEPTFRDVMQTFEPYFNREGTESSSTSMSQGIKSITEDTASLLASYINAMRADLSVIRNLHTAGWQDVKAIREAMASQYAPNYNEYMAQISANTFDVAQSNAEILARIKSVITASPSGGSAVRMAR